MVSLHGNPVRNATDSPNSAIAVGGVSAVQHEIAEMSPLSAPEKVLVKDGWNKFLAFQDMLTELFFERLLHEEPDLADRFGDAVDLLPGYFVSLFDQQVRLLIPQTEQILRESYRGIYPAPTLISDSPHQQAALLADLGMRPQSWITARKVWLWTMAQVPHLEEYDRENMALGNGSALYRFFSLHILPLAFNAHQEYAQTLPPEIIRSMRQSCEQLSANALAAGADFYQELFLTQPGIIPYFGRADVNSLSEHLMHTLVFLTRALEAGREITTELRELSRTHTNVGIPPEAYPKLIGPMMTVMRQRLPDFSPEEERAWTMLLMRVSNVLRQPILVRNRLLKSAKEFFEQIALELAWTPADRERRLGEIEREIRATGTYTQTYEELSYGAQLAWRNSTKCIGRIAWRNMLVRDMRHVTDPDVMFQECVEHMRLATNGGTIQTVMTVFRPKKPLERWGPRIWNSQYVRYAAYEQPDGTILGDPANLKLTQALLRQGWTPPARKTAFDYLPLAIEVPGQAPRLYEFEPDDVLQVPLEHPSYPAFGALGLKWCAVPAIANFRLDIGGVQYGCVPFNGWFMETEIARNLWEEGRYNQAEAIAHSFGLDTSSEQTLWRDRAFLELNTAVLHSFSKAKVTLVDHQTAARQFLTHDQREKRAGRECPAQWSWVVPSAGGSTTPVWHHEMRDFYLNPSFHYAADRWAVIDEQFMVTADQAAGVTTAVQRLLILYGSETGTAETYARQTARRLSRYHPQVMALDEYDPTQLAQEQWVLIIVSTFRKGELPGNAQQFYDRIQQLPDGSVTKLQFAVLALGSTIYSHFCAAGVMLDQQFSRLGANRTAALHKADEINGQADTFRQWLGLMARLLGEDPSRTDREPQDDSQQVQVTFVAPLPTSVRSAESRQSRLPGVSVPVVANRELLKEVIVGSRSTRFIAFDISGTDQTYETGDHVVIYPQNPPELVQRLCKQIGVDPDAYFTAHREGTDAPAETMYPEPVRVADVLTEDFDLSLREPYDELITALLSSNTEPADKALLEIWSELLNRDDQDADARSLKKHIADSFLTISDLLNAFPSTTLTFAQLIDLLPHQRPRLYSISSCSLVYPNQIHITVGVVQITTDAGYTRSGLCSNYLARLPIGATTRLYVRTSNFRPPRDPQAPMLMVGPGTGLSPLVGFLQHREVQLRALRHAKQSMNGHQALNGNGIANGHNTANGSANGKPINGHATSHTTIKAGQTRLFFGCRNFNDYLYQQELETWHEEGVLTHLDVAFSRLGDDRIYVQDLMGRQGAAIWAVLSQPDCHYYVCGDAKMADDVFSVLLTIARKFGGLSPSEAVEFFRTMQLENRFVTDVWGVLLNFRQSIVDVQAAKYAQGERWLMERNE